MIIELFKNETVPPTIYLIVNSYNKNLQEISRLTIVTVLIRIIYATAFTAAKLDKDGNAYD